MSLNALLFGASGLVGSELLAAARHLRQPAALTAISRRPLELTGADVLVVDFSRLGEQPVPPGADIAFCCLGTTIGAAGSRDAFRAVDHDLVLHCARWARQGGVRHFLVVTAVGADAGSPVFYNRVKGETERDLRALGFDRLSIMRPSLLLGERREHRRGEALAARLMPPLSALLAGPLSMYKPIPGRQVAEAMLGQALAPAGGHATRLHWREMQDARARLRPFLKTET